jgi:hypothetical protein
MDFTGTPDDVRAASHHALEDEIGGGLPTGMHAHREDGRFKLVHH